jgi:beta-N-acetylhexosaminidase
MSGRTLAAKLRLAALPVSVVIAAAACGSGAGGSAASPAQPTTPPSGIASPTPSTPLPSPTAPRTPPATAPGTPPTKPLSCVDRVLAGMTEKQRVGQLFMGSVDAGGATASQLEVLRRNDVGSVFLMGRTESGAAHVRGVTQQLQTLAPTVNGSRVGLLVSTDQEGGQVQVLKGPGFSNIPSAVAQGGLTSQRLQQEAREWGRQLRAAGVNVNLAPVADIVPPALRTVNAPIGQLDREYGNDANTVARQSSAVVRGLQQAGVYATLKHFPTLGEVRGNTDFSRNVTDDVTPRDGTFRVVYRAGIDAGARFVMASLATYQKIDPNHPSVFSNVLLRQVLRQDLGFRGVVISDDMGKAAAVSATPPGQRAVDFLSAGGDMVLTVQPSTVDAMTNAVLTKLPRDAAFRAEVNQSVHRILDAKLNAGLLACPR